jgi:phosphatidate cytidylyltransferase
MTFLILILVLLAIGGVGVYLTVRKDPSRRTSAWTKYVVYIAIVILTSLVIHSDHKEISWVFAGLLGALSINDLVRAKPPRAIYLVASIWVLSACYLIVKLPTRDLIKLYLLVIVFDGFSQIGGQLLKTQKVLPTISPNKSWGGIIVGSICTCITIGIYEYYSGGITDFVGYVPTLIMAAFIGDAYASYIKRKSGIKDYGAYLPEHGGVLDRYDSFFGVLIMYQIIILVL